MKKRLCAIMLCAAVLLGGCGEKTEELTLGDVTYNIPQKWINEQYKEDVVEDGKIVQYLPQGVDGDKADVVITIGYGERENEQSKIESELKEECDSLVDVYKGIDGVYDVKGELIKSGDVEGYEISYTSGTEVDISTTRFTFNTQQGIHIVSYAVKKEAKEKYDKEYISLLESITCETPVEIIKE